MIGPRRQRDQQQPVADIADHLKRCRPRADDHRGAKPDHLRPAGHGQRIGHLGAAGQVIGQYVVVGHEPAEVHDAADARIPRGFGDVRGGGVIAIAKPGLADRMHEVVDDVDGSGRGERRVHRRRIVGIQGDPGDLVMPAEAREPTGIACGGDDLVPVLEQLRGEPRADIAGGASYQNSRRFHNCT